MTKTTIINEDAMRIAGVSLYATDQAALNGGCAKVVFSAAQGADEGNLSGFVNADTQISEKVCMEAEDTKEAEEENISMARDGLLADIQEKNAEIRDGSMPVTVGWIEMTVDEWEDVEETLADPEGRDAVKEKLMAQGYSEAEALQAILVLEAMARIAKNEGTQSDHTLVAEAEKDPRAKHSVEEGLDVIGNLRGQSLQNDAVAALDENQVKARNDASVRNGSFSKEQGETYAAEVNKYQISETYQTAAIGESSGELSNDDAPNVEPQIQDLSF